MVKRREKKDKRTVNTTEYIPRESRPSKLLRITLILYFFFNFFHMKDIAAAPAYSTIVFSAKPKLTKNRIDKRSG